MNISTKSKQSWVKRAKASIKSLRRKAHLRLRAAKFVYKRKKYYKNQAKHLKGVALPYSDFDAEGNYKKTDWRNLTSIADKRVEDPENEKTFDYNVIHVESPLWTNSIPSKAHFEKRRQKDPKLTTFLKDKYTKHL